MKNLKSWLIVAVLGMVPVLFMFRAFHSFEGACRLIYFGKHFEARSLSELNRLEVVRESQMGYDGQFYAQLALSPLLNEPELKQALDKPSFRAQRILLPWLCYTLGLGQSRWVIWCWGTLNLPFYLLFAWMLARYLKKERNCESQLVLLAILLSTGSLISMMRALTDLPGAVFLLFVLISTSTISVQNMAMSMALLCKETCLLSLPMLMDQWPKTRKEWLNLFLRLCAVMAPFFVWTTYVRLRFGWQQQGLNNFSWPLKGWSLFVFQAFEDLCASPFTLKFYHMTTWEFHLFELLAALSIGAQGLYLLTHLRLRSIHWRMGIGWAVLMLFLSSSIFVEQVGFTRVLFPLTLAFNLMLWEVRTNKSHFYTWFLMGNIGLIWGWREMFTSLI